MKCKRGEYYSNKEKKCIRKSKCPKGKNFNEILEKCEDSNTKCKDNEMYDNNLKKCIKNLVIL